MTSEIMTNFSRSPLVPERKTMRTVVRSPCNARVSAEERFPRRTIDNHDVMPTRAREKLPVRTIAVSGARAETSTFLSVVATA